MSQPTPSDVHIDAALTDFSIAYMQAETNFIARRASTVKPVQFKTNQYHVFTKNDFFRDDAVKKRAPGTAAPRSGFTLSTDSYNCDAWWTSVSISEMVSANADPAVNLDEAASRLVTQRMLIRADRQFATDIFAASKWGTDVTGGTDFTVWSDASSDPENDVQVGKKTILQNTGLEPNTLIVSYDTHQALKRHPLIKDRFKYTSAESVTDDMIARFFEVDDYMVSKSAYATNAESGTAAYSFTQGSNALLYYRNPNPGIMEPTGFTTFVWSGLTGQNDLGVRIDQYFDNETKEDVVRGEFAFDFKVTGSDLGYFFSGSVS